MTTFWPTNSTANGLCKLWQGQSLSKTLVVNPGRPSMQTPGVGRLRGNECANTFQRPGLGLPAGSPGAGSGAGAAPGPRLRSPPCPAPPVPPPQPEKRRGDRGERLGRTEGLLSSARLPLTLFCRSRAGEECGAAWSKGVRRWGAAVAFVVVQLMPVRAQSGYCKLFGKCICLIEYLQQVWSKVKSGGVFKAPCSCCLSCKISELL